MKQTHNSRNTMIMAIIAVLVLHSCTKKEVIDDHQVEKTKVTFNVAGIDESVSEAAKEKKASANFNQSNNQAAEVITHNGFDVQLVTDHDLKVNSRKIMVKGKSSVKGSTSALRAAAMTPGNTYNLYLYKSDGTYVDTYNFSVGSAADIEVEKGETYNWYALSYNDQSTDIVDVNPATPTVKMLALPGNKDILHASDSFTVPTGTSPVSVPITIVFNHKVARIGIEINTMGMFANMNSAAVSVSGLTLKTGTLNLETGAWGTTLTDVVPSISWSNFVDVETGFQDAKIVNVYTASTAPTGNFTVTVSGLEIALDDGNPRSFNTLLTGTPSVFTFNITPQIANTHRALANLIESPLTIGSIRWARQNVYYSSINHNRYRFHHTYAFNRNRNTYFSFKGLIPTEFAWGGDPCAKVYPEGIWRTPTGVELGTLVTNLNISVSPNSGNGYVTYTNSSGTSTPYYPGNQLRFNLNGGSTVYNVADLINITLGGIGTSLQLWSSTPEPVLGTSLTASSLGGSILETLGVFTLPRSIVANANVSVIGLDVIQSDFKNVRCVRN